MKIVVSIPNTGTIRSELVVKLVTWLRESPYTVIFESSNLQPIEHNRNVIVQRFLKTDADMLLQIDSDNVPLQNPLNLVEYNKDIISCPVWSYSSGVKFLNVFKENKDETLIPLRQEELHGLSKIDATGTGIILCSRKVFETIKRPFERLYDENGIAILGLDLYFSQKAKEAGFKIYTHGDYIAKHYKTIEIGSM